MKPLHNEGADVKKKRYRILWPSKPSGIITHWLFEDDGKHYIAFMDNGRSISGYQLHREFQKP